MAGRPLTRRGAVAALLAGAVAAAGGCGGGDSSASDGTAEGTSPPPATTSGSTGGLELRLPTVGQYRADARRFCAQQRRELSAAGLAYVVGGLGDDFEGFAFATPPAPLAGDHEVVVPIMRDAYAILERAAEQASSATTGGRAARPAEYLWRTQFVAALNDAQPELLRLSERERRAGFRAAAERLGVASCLPPGG